MTKRRVRNKVLCPAEKVDRDFDKIRKQFTLADWGDWLKNGTPTYGRKKKRPVH
jgi:hypothetical protein